MSGSSQRPPEYTRPSHLSWSHCCFCLPCLAHIPPSPPEMPPQLCPPFCGNVATLLLCPPSAPTAPRLVFHCTCHSIWSLVGQHLANTENVRVPPLPLGPGEELCLDIEAPVHTARSLVPWA